MKLHRRQVGNCDIVAVEGEVTAADAPSLSQMFQASLGIGRHCIVLDLSRCTYIGSAGLSAIITAARACRRWNRGDLVLAAVSAYIQGILTISGLVSEERSRLRTFPTADEAVIALEEEN